MNFFADLKVTFRSMRRNFRFSLLAIFVMTSGLSLSIYMFSFLYNTLSAPLPFDQGERVRKLQPITSTNQFLSFRLSDYQDMAKSQTTFDVFDTYYNRRRNLVSSDRSFRDRVFYVNPPFFEVSNARPLKGRVINQDDMLPGAAPVVVIGEHIWDNLYGGADDVLGKELRIENKPFTIVGVMPATYRFPDYAKIWAPFDMTTQGINRSNVPYASVYGRLKEGVSDEQAEADLVQIMEQIALEYPELNEGESVIVTTFQKLAAMTTDTLILAMQLCVGLVLLLACINTGNLLLSRALEKSKESAIRTAMGATRGVLVTQVMMEAVLICLISGVLSLMIVSLSLEGSLTALKSMFLGSEPPYWWRFELTLESYLAAIFMTVATAVITGLLPAIKATKGDVSSILRDGTRGAQSFQSGRLSKLIVISEVALSSALLLIATSVALSVIEKNHTDYGIRLDGYLTAEVSLNRSDYRTDERRLSFFQKLEQELEKQPGVDDVSFTRMVPITWARVEQFEVEGVDYGKDPKYPRPEIVTVSNDYFSTVEIKLFEGRTFSEQDRADTPLVAIVSQNFIKKYMNGEPALGKRIKLARSGSDWYTIVGVVNDVTHGWPYSYNIERPSVFVNLQQNPERAMSVVIKTANDPNLLRETLRRVAFEVEPNAPLFNVLTMERNHERAVADINFISRLFILFAIASMILAFSGIYGVMAYTVTQKTQEIGVRRALGADNQEIHVHFLKQGAIQLITGLLVGIPVGIGLLNMLIQSELVSFSAMIFILVPLAISLTIVIAVANPVRKVLKLEPIHALRYE
ncbi:ADOP family duplicated permease [Aliikangiella sp. G2MR2-5]|uniref:ADOP family duplicated permease n=1 Tax=Aliikangiella sp. G2MR2-5 TaxID=2788943 RepID=UPI0018AC74DD|nr:ADOP family duplicated permease [Aliikangiella sp. G2MR2-5]